MGMNKEMICIVLDILKSGNVNKYYMKRVFFFSEILVNIYWSINGVKLSKYLLGFKRKRDFFDEI